MISVSCEIIQLLTESLDSINSPRQLSSFELARDLFYFPRKKNLGCSFLHGTFSNPRRSDLQLTCPLLPGPGASQRSHRPSNMGVAPKLGRTLLQPLLRIHRIPQSSRTNLRPRYLHPRCHFRRRPRLVFSSSLDSEKNKSFLLLDRG